jgi:hypothetical protein
MSLFTETLGTQKPMWGGIPSKVKLETLDSGDLDSDATTGNAGQLIHKSCRVLGSLTASPTN